MPLQLWGRRLRRPLDLLFLASVVLLSLPTSCSPTPTERAPGCRPPGASAISRVVFSEPPAVPSRRLQPPLPMPPVTTAGPSRPDPVFRAGTWARYSCDPGYLLLGDEARTCLVDGTWTGAAPHCYLNVAEHSSLATAYAPLTDGNLDSWLDLLSIFSGGAALLADLFFVYPLLELRLISSYNLTGMNIQIRLSDDNVSWIGVSMEVEAPSTSDSAGGLAVHTVSLQNTVLMAGARYIKVSLFHSSGTYFQRATFSPVWPLHELQIIADSNGDWLPQEQGLSRHQCLGDLSRPDITHTWSARGRCFHLISSPVTEPEARQICQHLGSEGGLFQPDAEGLLDMVIDGLSHERRLRAVRSSGVWMSFPFLSQDNSSTSTTTEPSGAAEPPAASWGALQAPAGQCQVLRRRRGGWVSAPIPCQARRRTICQRAPRLCGSPAQSPGLLYQEPQLRENVQSVGVACGEPTHASGEIQCRDLHWTTPDFCYLHVQQDVVDNSSHEATEHPATAKSDLWVTLAAVMGGAATLAVLAAAILCRAKCQRSEEKIIHEPYNSIEFWEHNNNPIYKPDDDPVYSEIGGAGGPEAIYDEPSHLSAVKRPPPCVEPPPLPSVGPPRTSVLPLTAVTQQHDDYEEFAAVTSPPTEVTTADRVSNVSPTATPTVRDVSALWPGGSTAAGSLQKGGAGYNTRERDTKVPPAPPPKPAGHFHTLTQEAEYSEPLVAGRVPGGSRTSCSLPRTPVGVSPMVPFDARVQREAGRPSGDGAKDETGSDKDEKGCAGDEADDDQDDYTMPYGAKAGDTLPRTNLPDVTEMGHRPGQSTC